MRILGAWQLAAAAGMLAVSSSAQAAFIVVDTDAQQPGDTGDCTLGEAIEAANTDQAVDGCAAGDGRDTILLTAGVEYNLDRRVLDDAADGSFALPSITSEIGIEVTDDAELPSLSTDTDSTLGVSLGLFHVAETGDLHLVGLEIHGRPTVLMRGGSAFIDGCKVTGYEPGTTCAGAIIHNDHGGALRIDFSSFPGSKAGAVSQVGGELEINGSSFVNHCSAEDAGVITTCGVQGRIRTSIFTNNLGRRAISNGGAACDEAQLDIDDSTFSGTNAHSGQNGAALANAVNGTVLVRSSLFTGLVADRGGAIYSEGTLTLLNSTLSGNQARLDGGGLYLASGSVTTLYNVTLTENTADADTNGSGSGGAFAADGASITVLNSIVAGNHDSGGEAPDCAATVTSSGYNVLGVDAECGGWTGDGDQSGTLAEPLAPGLAALADQGGPTLTHGLLDGSPALDHGNPATPGSGGASCPDVDQRGAERSTDRCDCGAFEASASLPVEQDAGTPEGDSGVAPVDAGVSDDGSSVDDGELGDDAAVAAPDDDGDDGVAEDDGAPDDSSTAQDDDGATGDDDGDATATTDDETPDGTTAGNSGGKSGSCSLTMARASDRSALAVLGAGLIVFWARRRRAR
jgi:hypothetical protein